MCLQLFAQTPMLSLINWRKKGSEWSRLKHSVLFGESGRVSILLLRNYPTICFTTSGNVEGFFRLRPLHLSRMSKKSFYELYTHTINVLLWDWEGSETQNRKNKSESWLTGVNTKLRSGKPIFPLGLTLIYR